MDHKTAEGWLTGVCAAIANRFAWNVSLVRILVVIVTIATAGVGGAVTYALLSQFIRTPSGRYGTALKTLAFWLLISFWSAIPLVYLVLPLSLLGLFDWERDGAGLLTVLGVANGATLPFILAAFCITRIIRWWRRRASP